MDNKEEFDLSLYMNPPTEEGGDGDGRCGEEDSRCDTD